MVKGKNPFNSKHQATLGVFLLLEAQCLASEIS